MPSMGWSCKKIVFGDERIHAGFWRVRLLPRDPQKAHTLYTPSVRHGALWSSKLWGGSTKKSAIVLVIIARQDESSIVRSALQVTIKCLWIQDGAVPAAQIQQQQAR
jgi:hypothetical protein